jgi:hypothetical protein
MPSGYIFVENSNMTLGRSFLIILENFSVEETCKSLEQGPS